MGLRATNRDLNLFLDIVRKDGGLRKEVLDRFSHDFLFSAAIIYDDMISIEGRFIKGAKSSNKNKDMKEAAGDRDRRATRDEIDKWGTKGGQKRMEDKGIVVETRPAFDLGSDKARIKKFADEFSKKIKNQMDQLKDTADTTFIVIDQDEGTYVYADTTPDNKESVYVKVRDALSRAQAEMVEGFKDVFYRASKGSPEDPGAGTKGKKYDYTYNIAELGHMTSVAESHIHLVDSILANMNPDLAESAWGKNLKRWVRKYKNKLKITATAEMTVEFKNGVIVSKERMHGQFESFNKNIAKTASQGAQAGEAEIKKQVYRKLKSGEEKGLLIDLQRSAARAMSKAKTNKAVMEGEGSIPFGILIGGMFTQLPSIKRLRKKGWVRGGKPFTHKPKSHAPVKSTGDIESEQTFVHNSISDLVRGFGPFPRPPPQRPAKNANAPEQVRDWTRLTALINQKLGQQVLGNMGHPGLVNRTGTFANSARVQSITPTGSGVPSIDYTYQRDPYEVFELERGKRPWATAQRDPTVIIDKSIREIAAGMALAQLTTRRQ